ncbi:MAG: hypothetical protein DMG42_22580 [Acidobacteria bacterium]|nr:MAG: hypothetical protein DMG42_22580 [Acidobacteriota bacterium]
MGTGVPTQTFTRLPDRRLPWASENLHSLDCPVPPFLFVVWMKAANLARIKDVTRTWRQE